MRDAIIIGGGPAGCLLGEILAKRGLNVAIVEEHAEIGQPMCCAGILGVGGLKELKINVDGLTLSELRGATFYPPSADPVTLARKGTEAVVIDRGGFDRELARRAADAGAEFMLKTRCTDVSLGGRKASVRVKIEGESAELQARLLIGADGANSIVARKAGLSKPSAPISCAQAEVVADIDPGRAELYFGREVAPGFFAWAVPAGEVCRVGLGTTEGEAWKKLLDFMERHPAASGKLKGKNLVHFTAGAIPEPEKRKIYGERVLLVGDAAGRVKPLTGGGIYIGLTCARLAAEVAAGALEREPDAGPLSEYEVAVNRKFGREFELGMRARRVFQRMSDEDLDAVFGLLSEPDVRELVLKHADFDHHAGLLKALMKKGPGLLRKLGARRLIKYMRWMLKS